MKFLYFHMSDKKITIKTTQNHKIENKFLRRILRKIRYNITPHNRVFLLKKMVPNSICAEIGVEDGFFSEQILKYSKPKKLHLIDIDISKSYSKFKDYSNVEFNEGSSKEILKDFKDEYFDWVYIDGDHSYDGCRSDLELSFQKIKNNGYVTGDNFHNDWHGVLKAVVDFIINYPVELIIKKVVRDINENLIVDLIDRQNSESQEFILYLDYNPIKLKSVKISKLNVTNVKNVEDQLPKSTKFDINAVIEDTSLMASLLTKSGTGPNTVLSNLIIKTKSSVDQDGKNTVLIVNLTNVVKNDDDLEIKMRLVETIME